MYKIVTSAHGVNISTVFQSLTTFVMDLTCQHFSSNLLTINKNYNIIIIYNHDYYNMLDFFGFSPANNLFFQTSSGTTLAHSGILLGDRLNPAMALTTTLA